MFDRFASNRWLKRIAVFFTIFGSVPFISTLAITGTLQTAIITDGAVLGVGLIIGLAYLAGKLINKLSLFSNNDKTSETELSLIKSAVKQLNMSAQSLNSSPLNDNSANAGVKFTSEGASFTSIDHALCKTLHASLDSLSPLATKSGSSSIDMERGTLLGKVEARSSFADSSLTNKDMSIDSHPEVTVSNKVSTDIPSAFKMRG